MHPSPWRPSLRVFSVAALALAIAAMAGRAIAATQYVNALGASTGWWSDDTRNQFGSWLNGQTETVPGYYGPGTPAGTRQGDAAIDLQIQFGDFYPGSSADGGLIRLWPTDDNLGKASIGTFSSTGFATTASLLSGFDAVYRVYVDPAPTLRTPVFRLSFVAPGSAQGAFAHFHTPMPADSWTTVSVDETSLWAVSLVGQGWIDDSAANPKTMAQWAAAHPEFFGADAIVFATGFNIGSGQRQCYAGIDWLETSLLNGGDRIEFGIYGWTLESVFVQDKPKPASDLWSAKGDLVVEDAPALVADVVASGITVSLDPAGSAAGAFVGDSVSFDSTDCNETSAANGVRCKSPEGSLLRLIPRPGKTGQYRAMIRIRRRDLGAPTLADAPLSVTLTTASALDAIATAADCRSLMQGSKIECRN